MGLYCIQHYLNSFYLLLHMTTLQPKTPLSYSLCFWFLLRCHVYCCWCSVFFSLFGKTETVYLPPAKESVLKDLPDNTGSMKSVACQAIKRWTSFTTYRETECPPPRPTLTPSHREQNIFVFTYATEALSDDLLTKGGGLRTKSKALALYVCVTEHLVHLWLLLESWKCFYVPLAFFFSNLLRNKSKYLATQWLFPIYVNRYFLHEPCRRLEKLKALD